MNESAVCKCSHDYSVRKEVLFSSLCSVCVCVCVCPRDTQTGREATQPDSDTKITQSQHTARPRLGSLCRCHINVSAAVLWDLTAPHTTVWGHSFIMSTAASIKKWFCRTPTSLVIFFLSEITRRLTEGSPDLCSSHIRSHSAVLTDMFAIILTQSYIHQTTGQT